MSWRRRTPLTGRPGSDPPASRVRLTTAGGDGVAARGVWCRDGRTGLDRRFRHQPAGNPSGSGRLMCLCGPEGFGLKQPGAGFASRRQCPTGRGGTGVPRPSRPAARAPCGSPRRLPPESTGRRPGAPASRTRPGWAWRCWCAGGSAGRPKVSRTAQFARARLPAVRAIWRANQGRIRPRVSRREEVPESAAARVAAAVPACWLGRRAGLAGLRAARSTAPRGPGGGAGSSWPARPR